MVSTEYTNIFIGLGSAATFIMVLVVPAAVLFHRRVIRPLRWVLGVAAADSPTGEAVLPVPQQLAELRVNQKAVIGLLGPNGGSSIIDLARKTHKLALSTDRTLRKHLIESSKSEKEIWQAIANIGPQTPGTTTTTTTTQSTVTDEVE